MKKVKCVKGHFFDMDKFAVCPLCGESAVGHEIKVEFEEDGGETVLLEEENDETVLLEEEDDETVLLEEDAGKHVMQEEKVEEAEDTTMLKENEEEEPEDSEKAVVKKGNENKEFPTGWLVCVKGAHCGQVFPLDTEKNKMGRNPKFDISLMKEMTVTEEAQAVVIYEPKHRVFYLQNGTSDGLVYLNEELLFSHDRLKAYDKIQIGNAEFIFIPLCGEQFTWDDYMYEGEVKK